VHFKLAINTIPPNVLHALRPKYYIPLPYYANAGAILMLKCRIGMPRAKKTTRKPHVFDEFNHAKHCSRLCFHLKCG
jgi:hypothetical protein